MGNDLFFRPLLGPVMSYIEHKILTKFLKLKPPVFKGKKVQMFINFKIIIRGYKIWLLCIGMAYIL